MCLANDCTLVLEACQLVVVTVEAVAKFRLLLVGWLHGVIAMVELWFFMYLLLLIYKSN